MSLTEILLAANCVLLLVVLVLLLQRRGGQDEAARREELRDGLRRELRESGEQLRDDMDAAVRTVGEGTLRAVELLSDALREEQRTAREHGAAGLAQMTARLQELEEGNARRMEGLRTTLTDGLAAGRAENDRQLEAIRSTVEEKLQTALEKRLTESFRSVSERLEQVHQGLGEMQALATDVGGLKKILAGVKTRGMLGEVQLGAILQEILAPGQYETNVETVPHSQKRVEYAIRLPGDGTAPVWLPIDAKFPGERYAQLQAARESGDKAAITAAGNELEKVLCAEAKDISTKYLAPPDTTSFGVMFLPCEGLYLEAVNRGLLEKLQRDYHVSLAGPGTMAAFLNSLQLGFRTLAIQQRSHEVWQVLAAVKTEFGKFTKVMETMRRNLNSTSQNLDELLGARTKKINLRLHSVEALEETAAEQILTDRTAEE